MTLDAKMAALLAALLVLCSCGGRPKAVTPSADEFAPYIKAYTGGIVTEDAVLTVELAQDAATMPTEGLFSTSPKTDGGVVWTDAGCVSYTPSHLEAGKVYTVRFALGKVLDGKVPEVFEFSITVKGKPQIEQEPEEADNGEAFRVKKASLGADKIEVVLSAAPVNAQVKGLVELKGAARSYIQVQDSLLTVHFEQASQELELSIDSSLKDAQGHTLGQSFKRSFSATEEKPALEIPLKGNILPDRQALILPFRAVNLSAVEVKVIKIYEKNVLMFLQDNNLNGRSELRRSGRLIYHGDIQLDPSKDLHKWNTHSIDLSGLFKQEPGAIYRIRLSFRMDQSLWGGKEPGRRIISGSGKPSAEDEKIWDTPNSYYWDNDYDWDNYNYKESNDPTKPSYYMDSDRFPAVQLIASDLGLMAQYAGTESLWVAATDLISAKPVAGAAIEVYDFQLQLLASAQTDANGLAQLSLAHKPFAVVAKAGGSTAYLKVTGGNERQTSRFDVGGETIQQGLKAFIYGERGVWRPGDTLHVNAIVANKGARLPEGHPATLEVYTPAGQFYTKLTRKGTDCFYSFDIPTKADDPTGYWSALLKLGGSSFQKVLHVETVKPNRLKIVSSFDTPSQELLQAGKTVKVKLQASWLSGSPAGGNKARAQLSLRPVKGSPFPGWEGYCFNDPSSSFSKAEYELYTTTLDGNGNASVNVSLPAAEGAPGMLQGILMTAVEEDGGDESFTTQTLQYSPYSAYVGIKVPQAEQYLETDKDQTIQIASVDACGKRVAGHKIEYAVYKLQWNWWWESPGAGELDSYVNGGSASRIAGGSFTSSAGSDYRFTLRVNYPDWGKYLILSRDKTSAHVSGKVIILDWPDYYGRASRKDPDALTTISFSTDKPAYQVGEKATVYIPAAKDGRALVSLENSVGVIRREWVATAEEDTPYSFQVTPEMAPNFYINLTVLQPYAQTGNDLPIRLYGVQRVKVENPDSHLEPQIRMPEIIHPEENFTVKIAEKSGKPMTYTLAIVDEGLLDLTAFQTPDPWSRMNKPEALGVITWDMYDSVIGAFGGKLSPIAAIGGDQDVIQNARKDNRFNPVVLCLPPRTLSQGTDVLQLKLPMYVGSVRVMLVAAHEGAYGKAEKTVSVQNPLMVVTTLPRILGKGEEVDVPVNVFAMEEGVREASVSIQADGPITIEGPATQKVSFSGKGDKLIRFHVKGSGEGVSHISVQATGSGHKASETIALAVRNPYPEVTQAHPFSLDAGASIELKGPATLQLSGFPAVDARGLYLEMKNYPYNCSEQLSARGISLVSLLPLLGSEDQADSRKLIPDILSALYARQNADGGFPYWKGGKSNSWVSSMAGHFLLLAQKEGFSVNAAALKAWKSYQKKSREDQLDESYRLYTLALAGEAQLGPMNRLKEGAKLTDRSRWMLSSAYALSGKQPIANALLDGIGREFPEYEPYDLSFGSAWRDRMLAVEALVRTGRLADAVSLAADYQAPSWFSTQESAFTAAAYRCLYEQVPGSGISASLGDKEIASAKSCVSAEVPAGGASLLNKGTSTLFGTVLTSSRTARKQATANGLKLEVKYLGEDGKAVNPASLTQGTRFRALIKVTNSSPARSYEALALSLPIASGWEIRNERLSGGMEDEVYDHLDIRDTQANWFFALPAGRSKSFSIGLRAAYSGSFVLPSIQCQDMYLMGVGAATADGTAVVKP